MITVQFSNMVIFSFRIVQKLYSYSEVYPQIVQSLYSWVSVWSSRDKI